jgi:hypothetical protein
MIFYRQVNLLYGRHPFGAFFFGEAYKKGFERSENFEARSGAARKTPMWLYSLSFTARA